MEKIKVQGAYLTLEQTAKLLGMSRAEVESVRRITDNVRRAEGMKPAPPLEKAKRVRAKSSKAE